MTYDIAIIEITMVDTHTKLVSLVAFYKGILKRIKDASHKFSSI